MSDSNTDREELLAQFERNLASQKAASTTREYTRHVGQYFDWLEGQPYGLLDIRPAEVKNFLQETVNEGYAPGYLKIRRAALRQFYDQLDEMAKDRKVDAITSDDVTDENPLDPEHLTADFDGFDQSSKQAQAAKEDYIAADADDVAQMAKSVPPSHAGGQDHRLLLKLMFYTGLRKSEVVRIRLSDFGEPDTFREPRSIQVRATKTDSNRTVYYPPELTSELDEWVNGVGRDLILGSKTSKYLFPSPDMGPGDDDQHITGQHVNRVVKESAKNAGIQEELYVDMNDNSRWKYTSHSLRHGFAESCLEEGMDLRTLAELMGHFDKNGNPAVDTTIMYLKGIDTYEEYEKHGPTPVEM